MFSFLCINILLQYLLQNYCMYYTILTEHIFQLCMCIIFHYNIHFSIIFVIKLTIYKQKKFEQEEYMS